MLSSVLKGIHLLFGTHLGVLASQVHAVVLSLLVAAWCGPWLAKMFRRMRHAEPEIEWVSLWRCPRCNTFNRRSFVNCTHCDYHINLGIWARWIPLWLSEAFKRNAQKCLRLYKGTGWILFYSITLFAFWKLRLYTFQQNSLLELLASVTMGLLLLSLFFFYQAFRPKLKSPLTVLLDLLAGMAVSGVVCFTALLWTVAPLQPSKPLIYINAQNPGQTLLYKPSGRRAKFNAALSGTSLRFDVQYAVLAWPFIGLRHVYVLRFSGQPMEPSWLLTLNDLAASPLQNERRFRPRLVLLSQTFQAPPGVSYILYEPTPGMGLALREK